MASDFSGRNTEKIDKLIAAVIELRTTVRSCLGVIAIGLPLIISLLAFLVLQSFATAAKVDRLSERLDRLEWTSRP